MVNTLMSMPTSAVMVAAPGIVVSKSRAVAVPAWLVSDPINEACFDALS